MLATIGSAAGRTRARQASLLNAINHLGLQPNLRLLLDAGDIRSWPGSGQTWYDLSGGGYHFFRGADGTASTDDPTANGVAGRRTKDENFSFDGGDRFTLGQSAPAWQSAMHKAGSKTSFLFWNYVNNITSGAPTQNFVGIGDATSSGVATSAVLLNASGTLRRLAVGVYNDSTNIGGTASTLAVDNNAWNMMGAVVDITAGSVLFIVNDTSELVTGLGFSSPSAVDSHVPLVLGAVAADGYLSLSAGCLMSAAAVWSAPLAAADYLAIYNATKGKYGR